MEAHSWIRCLSRSAGRNDLDMRAYGNASVDSMSEQNVQTVMLPDMSVWETYLKVRNFVMDR